MEDSLGCYSRDLSSSHQGTTAFRQRREPKFFFIHQREEAIPFSAATLLEQESLSRASRFLHYLFFHSLLSSLEPGEPFFTEGSHTRALLRKRATLLVRARFHLRKPALYKLSIWNGSMLSLTTATSTSRAESVSLPRSQATPFRGQRSLSPDLYWPAFSEPHSYRLPSMPSSQSGVRHNSSLSKG